MSDPERLIFYRPHWARDKSGTLYIPCSIWDEVGHVNAECVIKKGDEKYAFWTWLIEHPDYQRRLTEMELREAEDRFLLESNLSNSQ